MYRYDDSNKWVYQALWAEDVSEHYIMLFYDGQIVGYVDNGSDSVTSAVGYDGYTYLRGELKDSTDMSHTKSHSYSIARQV